MIRGMKEGALGLAAADVAEGFRLAARYGTPLLLLATLLPVLAHAQTVSGGTSPTTILNNIASFILGPFGQSIAVLSVIGIGVAFIFGRATLGLLGGLVGGLVLIFGASYLVTQFVGSGG
jgi:type IV secretion system protein VirB2